MACEEAWLQHFLVFTYVYLPTDQWETRPRSQIESSAFLTHPVKLDQVRLVAYFDSGVHLYRVWACR